MLVNYGLMAVPEIPYGMVLGTSKCKARQMAMAGHACAESPRAAISGSLQSVLLLVRSTKKESLLGTFTKCEQMQDVAQMQ